MPKSARAACLLFVAGLVCSSCRADFDDRSGEGLTHLEMYVLDDSMALDHAVFSELAANTSILQSVKSALAARINQAILIAKLARDGYPPGQPRLDAALAAFRGTERSSMAGDDQPFVLIENGVYRYGALVDLGFPEKPVGEQALMDGKFHWVATLTNQSTNESYAPLKIAAGMTACLFAGNSATNGFVAYWVSFTLPKTCEKSAPLEEGLLQKPLMLKVIRTEARAAGYDFDANDIPASTRIEWGRNNIQMIGLKCGEKWCQVVPDLATADDLEPMPGIPTGEEKEKRRNWRMKGRSDYQMLADRDQNGRLIPSGIFARIRPGHRKDMETPGNEFATVAEVTFAFDASTSPAPATLPEKYVKQGFSLTGTNVVAFCDATYKKCTHSDEPEPPKCEGQRLWGQVTNGDGIASPVFAVCVFVPPPNAYAPKLWITRWNWKADDEGLWVRCLNGCCTPKQ